MVGKKDVIQMIKEDLVIHKIFAPVAHKFSHQAAFQIRDDSGWQRYSYRELDSLSKNVGAYLINQGYQKGDCAVLILENCPEWGMIYLGMMYAGLTCVALDTELGPAELDNIFQDCRPVITFTSNKILQEKIVYAKYPGLSLARNKASDSNQPSNGVNIITVDSADFSKIKMQANRDVSWPEVMPSDVASLIYTSGTTAKPKGVVLTHRNFCSNFRSIDSLNICSAKDNMLSILPLYHTYAFMVTLLVPLLIGARITYAKSLKPEDLTKIIKEADITILTGVPQLFSLIHKAIFERINRLPSALMPVIMPLARHKVRQRFGRNLRLLVSGGARLEPRVGMGLAKLGFKVIEGYGLTETSPVVTLNPPEKPKFGSVGKPVPNVDIRILNPDREGVGEVLIKGPNVMRGYFRQPDLTDQVKSEDGWFNSQDLGYLDKEGYLFLTGRKKDVIVLSSGKNIYPEELEECYIKSPYIKEICIFQKTQEQFGQSVELLFAVVVPDFEYFRKMKEFDIQEKIRWELENLSSKLPAYKRIMGFVVSKEELPRTRLKKIKRYEVSRIYSRRMPQGELKRPDISDEDKGILDSEIAQKVIKHLSRQLNRQVQLDSHLEIDLGIDSLGRVELGMGLESLFSVKIPQELINSSLIVKELILNLQQITGSPQVVLKPQDEQRQKTWGEILNESPPEAVQRNIKISLSLLDWMLNGACKKLLEFIFRLFWFLKVEGREFIPAKGPYVFCPNHASYLDGFVLFSSVPLRCAIDLFFIGHAQIFEHPLVSWAVKIARLISIDPVTRLTEALKAASFVLAHKKLICIFPEGGRSIDSNVQNFKKGVGILAKELNIPLVPVYIEGTHHAWPRTKRFPRMYPLKIIFGKPFSWQDLGDDYASIASGLREEVLKLARMIKANKDLL